MKNDLVVNSQKYMVIARTFLVGNALREYNGVVIASDEAFYFVIDHSELERIGQLASVLGISGAKAIGKELSKRYEPIISEYKDLPDKIVKHPHWPIQRKDAQIIIVRRDAVIGLSSPHWGSSLVVTSSDEVFSVSISIFRWMRVIDYLRSSGWSDYLSSEKGATATKFDVPAIGLVIGALLGIVAINVPWGFKVGGKEESIMLGAFTLTGVLLGFLYAQLKSR